MIKINVFKSIKIRELNSKISELEEELKFNQETVEGYKQIITRLHVLNDKLQADNVKIVDKLYEIDAENEMLRVEIKKLKANK